MAWRTKVKKWGAGIVLISQSTVSTLLYIEQTRKLLEPYGLEDWPIIYDLYPPQRVLFRFNAYEHKPTSNKNILDALFCWPFARLWALRDFLGCGYFSGGDIECFQIQAKRGSVTLPWDTWKENIDHQLEPLYKSKANKVVCTGRAPLALWMYLGLTLGKQQSTKIEILNIPSGGIQGKRFRLWCKHKINDNDTLMLNKKPKTNWAAPCTPSTSAILYSALNPDNTFDISRKTQVEDILKSCALFNEKPVQFCTFQLIPLKNKILNDSDIPQLKDELAEAIEALLSKKPLGLSVCTSGPDVMAFITGQCINRNKVTHLNFVEYVHGKYQLALQLQ